MTNPIRPSEVVSHKATIIPDKVIEVFNHLIAVNFSEGRACFAQGAVIARLVEAGYGRAEIFSKKYLDVEDIYRAAGWKVVYDKPGWNETYGATFTFSIETRGSSGAVI